MVATHEPSTIADALAAACSAHSFDTIRMLLEQGDLPALLGAAPGAGSLRGLRLIQQKHRRDSAALLIAAELAGRRGEIETHELVLRYTRAARTADAWCLPHDPELPGLARLGTHPGACATLAWDADWPGAGSRLTLQRLLYNPGQRATFELTTASPARRYILKLLRADAFASSRARQLLLQHSGLGTQITLPRLIAGAPRDGALLYEFLPGQTIAQLDAYHNRPADPPLCDAIARTLVAIHASAPAGLPCWDGPGECARTRSMIADIPAHCADTALAALAQIEARLQPIAGRPHTGLIHTDFSARNVLYHRARPDTSPALAVIDWDSAALGPPEKDLASWLSPAGRQADGPALFAAYARHGGTPIDQSLVDLFVQHQRLLKACRRLLSGRYSPAKTNAIVQAITGQPASCPR
ncbi:MAG: aminoglycoside phosphotransferase family protein [Kouleothrix sp.]|jgi:hypothetical protein|nr:aminoglycoside phosphotransferase family protein [Kouleothrix sp.]